MIVAALDVDPQKCFTPICPDELPVNEGDLIVNELNKQAELAKYRILSKDAHSLSAPWIVERHSEMRMKTGLMNADLTWVAHAIPGTEGFEILSDLPDILEYDFVVWKGIEPQFHPYGACFHDLNEKLSTGLIEWLTIKAVDTVLVGGLAFDICVKNTAVQLAKKRTFNVVVNLSATRGTTDESIQQAKKEMVNAGVNFVSNHLELKHYLSNPTQDKYRE